LWEGNIEKTASHLYALLVTSLSTKFLAGQMWMKSDKWQMRAQLKAQQSSATQPYSIIHRTLQPCFLLLPFDWTSIPIVVGVRDCPLPTPMPTAIAQSV
jgi:hypothetical protein